MTTWILACDASRAKLFSAELREDAWLLVREFDDPEGRKPSREIQPSAPPGRMQESRGVGARRSSMEPHASPKENEAERFAKELAKFLEEATAKNEFDALVLAAPPHFLGMLKPALTKQSAKRLLTTVDKDLVMLKDSEIRQRLIDAAFPPK
jgi:protein required for attachment to host cells